MYEHKSKLSKREIDLFKNMKHAREILYLGVRLVDEECEYEPEKIAEYAIKKGHSSKLGYLAEVSLVAARNVGLEQDLSRLEKLINLLPIVPHSEKYEFLAPWKNRGYDKKVMRKLDMKRSTNELNIKWKIYSAVQPSDIEDYIQLYLIDIEQGKKIRFKNLFPENEDQLTKNFEEFLELAYSS